MEMTHAELLHRMKLLQAIINDIEAEKLPTPADDSDMWFYGRGRKSVIDTFKTFTPWIWEIYD